jgi:predicted O-methyltransferase YrrM
MNLTDIKLLGDLARETPAMTCRGRFPPSEYYSFLYLLAQAKEPKLSIELGVCGAGASYHLAKGHPQGRVIGYDIALEYPDNVLFVAKECPNWTFYRYDSCDTARVAPQKVDILFIDTVHTFEQTMKEWRAWKPWLAEGAVVCLDDLDREGMMDAWAEMPEPKMLYPELHIGGAPTDGNFGIVLL